MPKKAISVIFFCFLTLSQSVKGESENLSSDALHSLLALNYANLTLVKILHYQDRVVLDEEYHNIVNNINLQSIKDEEIIKLIESLMDALTHFQLSEGEKDILKKEHNKRIENAFYSSVSPGSLSLSLQANALSSLVKVGSSYHTYRKKIKEYRENLEKSLWEIKKEDLKTLNELQKTIFRTSWQIITRYNISDSWRLTEEQLFKFVNITQEEDLHKRLRLLKSINSKFKFLPIYQYHLAETAYEAGKTDLSFSTYKEILNNRINFFRIDSDFSTSLMTLIELTSKKMEENPTLTDGASSNVINNYLCLMIKNTKDEDWHKRLFAALHHVKLKNYDSAKKLIQYNIDYGYDISLNERVLGEIYATSGQDEKLAALISDMTKAVDVRYQDTFSLLGRINNNQLFNDTSKNTFLPVVKTLHPEFKESILRGEEIIIRIPEKWFKDKEGFTAKLIFISDNSTIDPDKFSIVDDGKFVELFFSSGIDNPEEFKSSRDTKKLKLVLSHIAGTSTIYMDVSVIDKEKDSGWIGSSLKDAKKLTGSLTNRLFSNKDETKESAEPATESSESEKELEPCIVIVPHHFQVGDSCYAITKDLVEKSSSCL